MISQLKDLSRAMTPDGPVPVNRRQAVVVAASATANRVDLKLYTSDATPFSAAYLDSYFPMVGDVVWVDFLGPDPLVIGSAVGPAISTAAAGANAGTSPPAPVITATTTPMRGRLTFGTGTGSPGMSAGAMVVITFPVAYLNVPVVALSPSDAATQSLGLYVSATSLTGFTISSVNAPVASRPNTTYALGFMVMA